MPAKPATPAFPEQMTDEVGTVKYLAEETLPPAFSSHHAFYCNALSTQATRTLPALVHFACRSSTTTTSMLNMAIRWSGLSLDCRSQNGPCQTNHLVDRLFYPIRNHSPNLRRKYCAPSVPYRAETDPVLTKYQHALRQISKIHLSTESDKEVCTMYGLNPFRI
jgi:hypothetical protein